MRRPREPINTPVLRFTDTDVLDLETAFEGILICGSPGSGKSSCSGANIAEALLRIPKMSGLILCAKGSESAIWIERIAKAGRSRDLIHFSLDSGHVYDPLHFERTRSGRGSNDPENLIEFFGALSSNGKKETSHGVEAFFHNATDQMMRGTIVLLDLAQEGVSIVSIDRVINSLPTYPGQHEEPAWQEEAYCAQLVKKVRERQSTLTEDEWVNLETVANLFFSRWPSLDDRPRSSIVATWSGIADRYLFNPYRRLFSGGKCTFDPETATREGKLVLCDFPMLEVGVAMGRGANTLMKICFQRAWLRRDLDESSTPCSCGRTRPSTS